MELLIAGASRLNIELNEQHIQQFQTYYSELTSWNSHFNLTSIIEYKDVQIKHFLDSLTVISAFPQPGLEAYKIIDIGAGAGFPGIPLKIAFPQINLTLLEATGKKVEFLRSLIMMLGLDKVSAINVRAEEAAQSPEYREKFDAVLARGLASMSTLVELTLPFVKIGGRLIAQKKGDIAEELAGSHKAIELLGGRLSEVKTIDLPELSDNRYLVIVDKIRTTPEKYPRRDGVPAKTPLR
jgi:16S rRNA (guanine527-N7)-methyltransferase